MEGEQDSKSSKTPILELDENNSEDNSEEKPINNQTIDEDKETDALLESSTQKTTLFQLECTSKDKSTEVQTIKKEEDVALEHDKKISTKLTKTNEWDSSKWNVQLSCTNEISRDDFLSKILIATEISDKVTEVRKRLIKFFNKDRNSKGNLNNFLLMATEETDPILKLFMCLKKHDISIKFIPKEGEPGRDTRVESIEIVDGDHMESNDLFDVEAVTNDGKNILHILFKRQNLMTESCDNQVKVLLRYRKCANILLDAENGLNKDTLYRLVNQQDNDGNTPLHYALKGWSQETVTRLLENGANIGIENNEKEDPLSYIPIEWLKDYLDNNSMEQTPSSFLTNDTINNYEEELKKETGTNILEETKPLYNEKVRSTKSVVFDYNFMVLDLNTQCKKDKECFDFSKENRVYEVEVLHKLSVLSEEKDRNLLLHPVLRFFIWIKWSRIRPYVIRKLTLQFLFCLCTTWFLLIKYDLKRTVDHCFFHFMDHFFTGIDECEIPKNSTTGLSIVFRGNVSADFQYLPGCTEDEDDPQLKIYNSCLQYCSFGYIAFIIQFIIQLYVILNNYRVGKIASFLMKWRKAEKKGGDKPKPLNRSGKLISKLSAFPCIAIDILNLTIQFFIMIGGRCQLTWVLRIFLPIVVAFRLSKASYWIFMNSKSLLNKKQEILYHGLEVVHAVLLIELFFGGITDSTISRGLTAILLFFLWVDFFLDVVLYASYSAFVGHFKKYVMMFTEVQKSFLKVLSCYSIFFCLFGLGFYIVFQPEVTTNLDNANSKLTNASKSVDTEPNLFGSRVSAIVKTFAMFVGEIDFANLPIDHEETDWTGRYNRTGVVLAYIYFILFVFIAVIVLMNLLNAIAIQDAKQIVKKAKFLEEENRIGVLLYFDFWNRLLLDLVRKLPHCCKLGRIEKSLLRYSNIFLNENESDDMESEKETMGSCNKKVLLWSDSSETPGKMLEIKARDDTLKGILDSAQNILVQNYITSFQRKMSQNN